MAFWLWNSPACYKINQKNILLSAMKLTWWWNGINVPPRFSNKIGNSCSFEFNCPMFPWFFCLFTMVKEQWNLPKLKTWFSFFFFQDKPNVILPDSTVSQTTQGKWLLQLCEDHIKKFVFNADEMTSLVEQTEELQQAEAGGWRCRAQGCGAIYAYHSGRVR